MMNDTVRAELLPKASVSKPLRIEMKENSLASGKLNQPNTIIKNEPNQQQKQIESAAAPTPASGARKQMTSDISVKPTSPTLVEFHSKNSSVPEWRLQLQNAVRKRHDRENPLTENLHLPDAPRKTKLATSGANALRIETIEENKPARAKNPTLSSALERIEKARRQFLVEEAEEMPAVPTSAADTQPRPASKTFPFYIASKQAEVAPKLAEPNAPENLPAKPKLAASSLRNESGDLDTNKLPSLPVAAPPSKVSTGFDKITPAAPKIETKIEAKAEQKKKIVTKPVEIKEIAAVPQAEIQEEHEEFEDAAPFAMRFNAGLFDLIIGAFLSLFLLAPFMLTSENWFTFTGLLAFLATCSIVMFIYLTATIGFYGRTFGMRLFSLEVIDIEGENYPTLHQSAVSSAVYLLSLAFGGVGFLTLFFNEDRRAAHDLISGTIVVKEN